MVPGPHPVFGQSVELPHAGFFVLIMWNIPNIVAGLSISMACDDVIRRRARVSRNREQQATAPSGRRWGASSPLDNCWVASSLLPSVSSSRFSVGRRGVSDVA